MNILAIDPGPKDSAFIVWDVAEKKIVEKAKDLNESIIGQIGLFRNGLLAVEMVACYGMPVGATVFDTCVWIGRFIQAWPGDYRLVYRKDIKLHFCNSMRAKDGNVRQALIDRFGGKEKAIGRKANPGVLYGVHGDEWSALAIAYYVIENLMGIDR